MGIKNHRRGAMFGKKGTATQLRIEKAERREKNKRARRARKVARG